ncbi:MAG: zinc ribbon domain-containing protein [Lachnospiraceae bacterium]
MMNFEEISKKVKKFSKDTMVEVQKMNEVRQLNSKVNEEKRYLNKLYLEMGKKLYDKYKDADTAPEGFEAEFRKITERYSVMDLLQDEIRQVKGVVLCPCCNMEVAATERFCSNCGNRMPEPVKIEGKEDGEVIDSVDGKEANTEEAAETVVDVEAEDVTESSVQEDTSKEEGDAEAVEEAAEAESDAKADVTEKIVEESDAARSEEVTEEVPGADAGAATEEALEEAEETTEEIPAEAEAAAEESKETVQADKTDEVAAEADEAAAAKASEKPKEE